ncbi:MAG: DUF4147 domain-containing protein [Phycisphaerales bacterium]|nr:DUF4147 domain-containing protein [Phycisphaerales bacterium]
MENAKELREVALDFIREATRAADPVPALRRAWIPEPGRLYALAIGKAASPMAAELQVLCGDGLVAGLIVGPDEAVAPGPAWRTLGADHPYPTPRNEVAGWQVASFVERASTQGTLLVALSGGGSAYLSVAAPGLTVQDLASATLELQLAGATIGQLNLVRKHLEVLKGGRLGLISRGPTRVYVLSDVLGDPLDVISSGPFAPDPTTFAAALRAIEERGLTESLTNVARHLRDGARGMHSETPKPGDAGLAHIEHVVVASNATVLNAVASGLERAGFCVTVRRNVEGEASEVGRSLAREAIGLARSRTQVALVFGGETTVTVGSSRGVGGPSQELALAAGLELEAALGSGAEWLALAYSTDGRDGPTDAAGALVDARSLAAMREGGCDPVRALTEHDVFGALRAGGASIEARVTHTNLNHVGALLVRSGEPQREAARQVRAARQQSPDAL